MNLKSWVSPKVQRREGSLHGLGLFALEPIKKDELLAIKAGHIVDEQFVKLNSKLIKGSHMEIAPGIFLAPTSEQEWSDALIGFNHSCEPNSYVNDCIKLFALRDVNAGEELTIDYGTTYISNTQNFKCLCGTESCRGQIGQV
jgi:SET domain-containing protein